MSKRIKKFLRECVFIMGINLLGIFILGSFFEIQKVSGNSMQPTLNSGDLIFIQKHTQNFSKGEIIVFNFNNSKSLYIKRIEEVYQNRLNVVGDNKLESLDSRNFGSIEKSSIVGKALFSIWPIKSLKKVK